MSRKSKYNEEYQHHYDMYEDSRKYSKKYNTKPVETRHDRRKLSQHVIDDYDDFDDIHDYYLSKQ